ncbi:hypothetical protein, partial [Mesorhizobium sp. M5C.F.Cr.IN.023.01.1.1]|uniref:hypothetical protein n=1 Tax=Mesorhizobium sp. M5C.F.Cr.IN.023.01.1.1 TaxID=2496768 RepID=UPI0013E2A919
DKAAGDFPPGEVEVEEPKVRSPEAELVAQLVGVCLQHSIELECSAFGLPEPAIGGALIDGVYLASRVCRYLVQHPYVRTLTINA